MAKKTKSHRAVVPGSLPNPVAYPLRYPNTVGASGASGGSTTPPFPRLVSVNTLNSYTEASTYRRFGLHIAPLGLGTAGILAAKAANPAAKVLCYIASDGILTSAFSGGTFDGMLPDAQHWLGIAGTTVSALGGLSTSGGTAAATLTATITGAQVFFLVDSGANTEIVAGSVSGTTLTITGRGQYGTTAVAHSGTPVIRPVAYQFANMPMLNCSTFCPTVGGRQWKDVLALYVAGKLASAPWDGVFLDIAVSSLYALSGGNITTQNVDADNDNVGDGGDGATAKGGGWRDGMAALFAAVRAQVGTNAIILGNNGYYDGYSDGRYVETFSGLASASGSEFYSSGPINGSTSAVNKQWQAAFAFVDAIAGQGRASYLTVANADNLGTLPTDYTNPAWLQKVRFNLACVLMTNAFYAAYAGTSNQCGAIELYDEYDGGQGGTLTADPSTTSPGTLTLATGMGARFKIGDTVRVPPNPSSLSGQNVNDEQMTITAIAGDVLTATRAVNGTINAAHPIGSKVVTDAMLDAGRGWLGQALGGWQHILATGANQIPSNTDFESGTNSTLTGWTLSGAANTSYFGRSAAGEGYSGTYAAKATITTANPGSPFGTSLFQDTGLSTVLNNLYTIGVWARCDKPGGMNVMVGFYASTTRRASQIIRLTQQWQYYTATFQSANAADNLRVQFNLNDALGTIWLDQVSLYASDWGCLRRDFTNGIVLLNGTSASITTGSAVSAAQGGGTVSALGGTFRRILGTGQNAANDGSSVTSVVIPSMDAVILRR